MTSYQLPITDYRLSPVSRILFFTATTGYQARAFEDAARALDVELVYATDHCHRLGDLWRDGAIAVKFDDVATSLRRVRERLAGGSVGGVVAVGDAPAMLAAHVASALGVAFHPPLGAENAASKLRTRGRLLAAGLPVPWFAGVPLDAPVDAFAERVRFPCVIKPVGLSASRGVIRADTPAEFLTALERLRRLLHAPDVRQHAVTGSDQLIVEGFIPGLEYALEGVMEHGALRVLAIFAKPDPLDGPFFEETIYVTPPSLPEASERLMAETIARAALALGLHHGPVHAECRVNEMGVFVLEVAARPIGGLCARSLRFVSPAGALMSLEEVLLRHARGECLDGYAREADASAVMMLPVGTRGYYRRTEDVEQARAVPGVEDVVMTAQPGQLLEPLPEGHSYPGFVFARAPLPEAAVKAVREAHRRLRLVVDVALPIARG
jgi:biotin carboxylase